MYDPNNVLLGPGLLYVAVLGSMEPTDLTSAWPAAWLPLGYTKEGHTFKYEPAIEPIEVAEELDPIKYAAASRKLSVAFILAESTATNLQRAMNGGTVTPGTGIVTQEPPAIGEDTSMMLGWKSDPGDERWVWRKCLQTGAIEMNRRKAPDYATIPTEWMVQAPGGGTLPFKRILAAVLV